MPNGAEALGLEPFEIVNGDGEGDVLILCEHASWHVPAAFDLGLRPEDEQSHAAWDPGARGVALRLSEALDAPLVAGTVSRLVYDCNRPPDAESAMPVVSERISIPGNRDLRPEDREARTAAVYRPFVSAVDRVVADRASRGKSTLLITVHSFTPRYFDEWREVEIGILHDADSRLADAMLAAARNLPHRHVARNQPYGPEDGVTHSLRRHGLKHGFPNAMIELRNDLVQTPQQQEAMARELLLLIRPAMAGLEPSHA